jgi:hypothetical protein
MRHVATRILRAKQFFHGAHCMIRKYFVPCAVRNLAKIWTSRTKASEVPHESLIACSHPFDTDASRRKIGDSDDCRTANGEWLRLIE